MSFGDDEPNPPGRPAWLRPESVLPATLTPELVLARTGEVAIAIPVLSVYPAGFELELMIRLYMDRTDWLMWALHPSFPRPPWLTVEHVFRFAVLYADGRAITNLEGPGPRGPGQNLTMTPSGGSDGGSSLRYYIQPLPPPGPLTLICEWPAQGITETRHEIDAHEIIDASARAVRLWPDQEESNGFTSSFQIGFDDEEPDPGQTG
jgi:hypothetical protein